MIGEIVSYCEKPLSILFIFFHILPSIPFAQKAQSPRPQRPNGFLFKGVIIEGNN
jgi:hypothetical protein